MPKTIVTSNPFVDGKYEKDENAALKEFIELSARFPAWFASFSETQYGTVYDVDIYNSNGIYYPAELKKRKYRADELYSDCYIELSKWTNLMRIWREDGFVPMYVNFIGDWRNVYIWFLPQVINPNVYLNVLIKQGDTDTYKYEDRLGLKWNNAYHFVWDDTHNIYKVDEPKIKGEMKRGE